jgi:hypothetical protein
VRHLLVSSSDGRLSDALRPFLPADTVVLSARGVDDTLERLARSSRVDAVVTDDPEVVEAIRAEIPGTLPVLLVPAESGARAVLRLLTDLSPAQA